VKITVASGKGGTGKTTISIALAHLTAKYGIPTSIADCDVEEPNVNLFLQVDDLKQTNSNALIPKVDLEKCNGCGECEKICQFSAIILIKGKPLVLADMCHSCGGCFLACPVDAITEIERPIGVVETGSSNGIDFYGGRLNIGEAMAPPLIRSVKKTVSQKQLNIVDSPPGTSCPVIESVDESDFVVLVTEPTPFGLNDLKLAVNMLKEIDYPFGIVINRSDKGGDFLIDEYCTKENLKIIGRIPMSMEVAKHYSRGDFADYLVGEYEDVLIGILHHAGFDLEEVK